MARPRKVIDPKMVEVLAQRGCSIEEMAHHFGCSRDTIERRFAAIIAKGKATLRTSLREWQIQAAKRGNTAMLIWLGKQYLDQADKLEEKIETKTDLNAPIQVTIGWADESAPLDAKANAGTKTDSQ
jgi:transposase